MISNIRTGAAFSGAISYHSTKVENGKATLLYCSNFSKDEVNYKEMLQEFEELNKFCGISKPVFHTSLNFATGEELSDETLKSIADEYMKNLGYGDTPYTVFQHHDAGHQHLHIVSANITMENGKYRKINDSYQKLESQKITREIEVKYSLVCAITGEQAIQGQKQKGDKKNYGETNTYNYLTNVISNVLVKYQYSNIYAFNKYLKDYNIRCYSNISKYTNKPYYNFSFIDENNKSIGVKVTSNKLNIKYEELNNKLNNEVKTDDLKKYLLDNYLFISNSQFDKIASTYGYSKVNDYYINNKTNTIVNLKNYFPQSFINDVTIKSEYFLHIAKCATEFRNNNKIFHESTFYAQAQELEKFKEFFKKYDTHLSRAQKELLLNSFIDYKTSARGQIVIQKTEQDRNIKLVNKYINYVNTLDISKSTAIKLLNKFNINIQDNVIKIGNTIDNAKQELNIDDIDKLNNGTKFLDSYVDRLSENDILLIKAAVDERSYTSLYDVNWEITNNFVSNDYIELQQLNEKFNVNIDNEQYTTAKDNIRFPSNIFGGRPADDGVMRKKKKGDDDENNRKKRGRIR